MDMTIASPVACPLPAGLIRPGDTIVVAQGPSMPQTLCEALVATAGDIGEITVFLGGLFASTFDPAKTPRFNYVGYGAIGEGAAALSRAGRLGILPTPFVGMTRLFAEGHLPADVVLLQLSAPRNGVSTVGLNNDYAIDAARRARVVIAEVNDQMPWVAGAELPTDIRIDHTINVSRPPITIASAPMGAVERQIGERVAALIPDGATLQIGIGGIPDAILGALSNHRELGLHSGNLGDRVVDLIEQGVITNSRKPIDAGISVANALLGTERMLRFVDGNPAVRLLHCSYTHALQTIARIPDFFCINSAVEVDLTGQVNAETVGGRYVGAVGGQPDFVRGALAAPRGRSVLALPATGRQGKASRIVAALDAGTVTTPRSDADIVVTEWGVADLRGQTLQERARRMAAVAAPEFREALAQVARDRFNA